METERAEQRPERRGAHAIPCPANCDVRARSPPLWFGRLGTSGGLLTKSHGSNFRDQLRLIPNIQTSMERGMRNENHKSGPNTRQCAAMAAVAASLALLGKRRKEPLSLSLSLSLIQLQFSHSSELQRCTFHSKLDKTVVLC